jgi:hypothetical protein
MLTSPYSAANLFPPSDTLWPSENSLDSQIYTICWLAIFVAIVGIGFPLYANMEWRQDIFMTVRYGN